MYFLSIVSACKTSYYEDKIRFANERDTAWNLFFKECFNIFCNDKSVWNPIEDNPTGKHGNTRE